MRLLDLFCGRWGWSRAFAARGWECVGVDIANQRENMPNRCDFWLCDILEFRQRWLDSFDFAVASPPCEQFSIHGLKMWFKSPPYPKEGIQLFLHTWAMLHAAGIPYVIENVRSAEEFVGIAANHCGPFYLWGTAVPPIMPQGITKGSMLWSERYRNMKKSQRKREAATIPPELANCVAEYAERLLESKV